MEPLRTLYPPIEPYRIVKFDQRGAGRSRPHASVADNTTWDLVEDRELLRRHLAIETACFSGTRRSSSTT